MPTIISLFDRTGNWSQPYRDAGYDVYCFDLQTGHNIYDFTFDMWQRFRPVQGILLAPPCDNLAVAGAKHFAMKDNDGRTQSSIKLFNHCLDIVEWICPNWWALENPVGRVNSLIPRLIPFGPRYFQPWWWGKKYKENYTKKTGLWGSFNFPAHDFDTEMTPDYYYSSKIGFTSAQIMKLGGKSQKTKNLRSATPRGFAEAFFRVNP
jgi:hypothetical protein